MPHPSRDLPPSERATGEGTVSDFGAALGGFVPPTKLASAPWQPDPLKNAGQESVPAEVCDEGSSSSSSGYSTDGESEESSAPAEVIATTSKAAPPVPPAPVAPVQNNNAHRTVHLTVDGCQHASVRDIIHGTYSVHSQNHGKVVFRRSVLYNNLDVLIYFWDGRDGADMSGWWFAPSVGGEQVWAHNPAPGTEVPPRSGWRVPHDGPLDEGLVVQICQQPLPASLTATLPVEEAKDLKPLPSGSGTPQPLPVASASAAVAAVGSGARIVKEKADQDTGLAGAGTASRQNPLLPVPPGAVHQPFVGGGGHEPESFAQIFRKTREEREAAERRKRDMVEEGQRLNQGLKGSRVTSKERPRSRRQQQQERQQQLQQRREQRALERQQKEEQRRKLAEERAVKRRELQGRIAVVGGQLDTLQKMSEEHQRVLEEMRKQEEERKSRQEELRKQLEGFKAEAELANKAEEAAAAEAAAEAEAGVSSSEEEVPLSEETEDDSKDGSEESDTCEAVADPKMQGAPSERAARVADAARSGQQAGDSFPRGADDVREPQDREEERRRRRELRESRKQEEQEERRRRKEEQLQSREDQPEKRGRSDKHDKANRKDDGDDDACRKEDPERRRSKDSEGKSRKTRERGSARDDEPCRRRRKEDKEKDRRDELDSGDGRAKRRLDRNRRRDEAEQPSPLHHGERRRHEMSEEDMRRRRMPADREERRQREGAGWSRRGDRLRSRTRRRCGARERRHSRECAKETWREPRRAEEEDARRRRRPDGDRDERNCGRDDSGRRRRRAAEREKDGGKDASIEKKRRRADAHRIQETARSPETGRQRSNEGVHEDAKGNAQSAASLPPLQPLQTMQPLQPLQPFHPLQPLHQQQQQQQQQQQHGHHFPRMPDGRTKDVIDKAFHVVDEGKDRVAAGPNDMQAEAAVAQPKDNGAGAVMGCGAAQTQPSAIEASMQKDRELQGMPESSGRQWSEQEGHRDVAKPLQQQQQPASEGTPKEDVLKTSDGSAGLQSKPEGARDSSRQEHQHEQHQEAPAMERPLVKEQVEGMKKEQRVEKKEDRARKEVEEKSREEAWRRRKQEENELKHKKEQDMRRHEEKMEEKRAKRKEEEEQDRGRATRDSGERRSAGGSEPPSEDRNTAAQADDSARPDASLADSSSTAVVDTRPPLQVPVPPSAVATPQLPSSLGETIPLQGGAMQMLQAVLEEAQRRQREEQAVTAVRAATRALGAATLENFGTVREHFNRTLQLELGHTGAQRQALWEEASRMLAHATGQYTQNLDQKRRFEAMQQAEQQRRMQEAASAHGLHGTGRPPPMLQPLGHPGMGVPVGCVGVAPAQAYWKGKGKAMGKGLEDPEVAAHYAQQIPAAQQLLAKSATPTPELLAQDDYAMLAQDPTAQLVRELTNLVGQAEVAASSAREHAARLGTPMSVPELSAAVQRVEAATGEVSARSATVRDILQERGPDMENGRTQAQIALTRQELGLLARRIQQAGQTATSARTAAQLAKHSLAQAAAGMQTSGAPSQVATVPGQVAAVVQAAPLGEVAVGCQATTMGQPAVSAIGHAPTVGQPQGETSPVPAPVQVPTPPPPMPQPAPMPAQPPVAATAPTGPCTTAPGDGTLQGMSQPV